MGIPGFGSLRTLTSYPEFRKRPLTTVARAATWSLRRRLGRQQLLPISEVRNVKIALPIDWWSWNYYVFRERRPTDIELLWLLQQIKPGMVAVDVGAHYGSWTAVLAAAVGPEGKIFAFEPTASTRNVLERTLAVNRLGNVSVRQVAVGNQPGEAQLYLRSGSPDMNSFGQVGDTSEQVSVVTLDDEFEPLEHIRVDVLKIDTEGNEQRVIEGARRLMTRSRPIVVFEANPRAAEAAGLEPDGAWRFLSELGYSMYRVDMNKTLVPKADFWSASDNDSHWNVVAIH